MADGNAALEPMNFADGKWKHGPAASELAKVIANGVPGTAMMPFKTKFSEQEILEQMKMLGANNIVITPIVEQKEGKVDSDPTAKKEAKRFTPGLSYLDAEAIRKTIPEVGSTASEVVVNSVITREGHHRSGKVVGVDSAYFDVMNLRVAEGATFGPAHFGGASPVTIIVQGVK